MTKKIKNTILSLFVATVAFAGAGVAAVSVDAQTEKPTITTAHIKMLEGASVRKVSNANGGYGIRFTGRIEKSVKEAAEAYYGAENVEYGMLICPNDFLTAGVTLDFDETDGLAQYVQGTTANTDKFFQSRKANEVALEKNEDGTDGNYYQFRCALTDVQEANLDREFAAAAYIGVRNSASEAFTYTVSGTTSRNIYTVATHALNDATSGLDENATKYLTESVVDIVNEEYTTTNVEIVSNGAAFESGLFETGDTFTVNATVENAEGKKLEAGVALNSDLITKISNNTYEVSELGELDLTATFKGFETANETYKETYKCDTKNILPTTIKEAYSATLDSSFEATPYTIDGVEAYKFNTAAIATMTFAYEDYSTLKAGDFVTFDVYGVDSPTLQLAFYDTQKHTTTKTYTLYNATDSTVISGTIVDDNSEVAVWTTYNVDGTEASRSMFADAWDSKWVRIQIELKQDATWNNRFGFVVIDNEYHDVDKGLYFANIQFRTYSEGYSDVRFADFDESKTYDFGTEIALEAEALTNRGIWEEVEAECSLVSGNGVVADNVFTVGLGESKLQFAFNGMQKDITVKGADYINLTNSLVSKDSTLSSLTGGVSYTDKNNVKMDNAVKYEILGTVTTMAKEHGISFADDMLPYMTKDMYLYFDLCCTAFNTFFISQGGTYSLYSTSQATDFGTSKANWQIYQNGKVVNGSINDYYQNQWVTVEYKLPLAWSNGVWVYMGFVNTNYSDVYLANIELRETAKDYSVMNLTADTNGVIELTKYAGSSNTGLLTLNEVGSTEIAAVNSMIANTTVLEWRYSDEVVENPSLYDCNKAEILLPARHLKKDSYLYFDVYCTKDCTIMMFANGSSNSPYCLLYSSYNQDNVSSYKDYEFQIYDAEGNAFTSGNFNAGSFKNQWVTVEFKLMTDWDGNDGISFYNTTYNNLAINESVYLANMKISSTKLLGTTANA